MLNLGALAFTQPWILLALAGLPLLWWLLRVTPPSPKRVRFPALRFLLGLSNPEETPARTPLWLILLRMAIAALIILALAGPLLNPSAGLDGRGPLVLVIDDGWASARQWESRLATADSLLTRAERDNRPVVVLPTAPAPGEEAPAASSLVTATEARSLIQGLEPRPWPTDRAGALAALDDLALEGPAQAVWLSDGLDDAAVPELVTRLRSLGELALYRDDPGRLPHLLYEPDSEGGGLRLRLGRLGAGTEGGGAEESVQVRALGDDGRLIARSEVTFAAGEATASALLGLPSELRNRIGRLALEGQDQAAGVLLLDERWRRRPVGLVSGGGEVAQPLLSDLYYLRRALQPFTNLNEGEIGSLLEEELAVMVLADVGALPESEVGRLGDWVESGGLLIRFAGPRLAESDADSLLPVRLRGGGRILGGVLTWDTPSRLAPFDEASPFEGLPTPEDVTVRRQVLAEPSLELNERTWARLTDGTPLVTAEHRGDGWLVLVHTTANTEWSDLALSGLFVDMMRRMVALSQGVAGEIEGGELAPIQTLDGFGRLTPPLPTTLALDSETLVSQQAGATHPPGYYGGQGQRSALNLAPGLGDIELMGALPRGVIERDYAGSEERSAKAWLLTAALLLALADLLVALLLRGLASPGGGRLLKRPRGRGAAAGAALLLLFAGGQADAQQGLSDDEFALAATLETRLAYVETGVPEVDAISEAGLAGLTGVLQRRTSVEPGPPLGVTLGEDDITLFPLLYWPITPEQPDLDAEQREQVNHFLTHGGTIFFDLREPSVGSAQIMGTATPHQQALRRLTEGLEIPPLQPVPPEHVLTKAFYLMGDFPGRYDGGTLWIAAMEGSSNDGISPVLVGSNDWAGAWAIDEMGRSRLAVVPGGEQQREMAYRVGVNLVMYALTGNYKADQVHVPFILERLGQ